MKSMLGQVRNRGKKGLTACHFAPCQYLKRFVWCTSRPAFCPAPEYSMTSLSNGVKPTGKKSVGATVKGLDLVWRCGGVRTVMLTIL